MNSYLIAISGPYKGKRFAIGDKLTIGRAADNTIRLEDDSLVSDHHCAIWPRDGRSCLRDGDSRNGTWVNGRARTERNLEQDDRIDCGSSAFLFQEGEIAPNALVEIIDDEADRRRELLTLRADYSVRGDAAVYQRGVVQVLLKMAEALDAIEDPALVPPHLLELTFEAIPAQRGALLLNGRRVSSSLADMISKTFRMRGQDGDAPFNLSSRILEEVYSEKDVVLSNSVVPIVCAPLIAAGTMRGVLYMEGAPAGAGFDPDHLHILRGTARLCVTALRLADKVESYRDAKVLLEEKLPVASDIVGKSRLMQAVREQTDRIAKHDITVLIGGETGTGKGVIARQIHEMSARRGKPFVGINCAAIPEPLLESELFGHAKGAFTGATAARKGKFQQANSGTIFLDEIGELGYSAQSKLLSVIQEGSFSPVGQDATVEVDVRIIAATNVDLEEAIRQNKFRKDLFYRLNVVSINVPPLRDRREDIPPLVHHFAAKYRKLRSVTAISPEAIETLMAHDWPGNVRELENAIQAALVNGDDETIRRGDLPPYLLAPKDKKLTKADLLAYMEATGSTAAQAAKHFGISRAWAYRLLDDGE